VQAETDPLTHLTSDLGRTFFVWGWLHKGTILVSLVMAGAAIWGGAWLLVGPEVAVYPVVRGDLVKTIVASGHVQTPYRVTISSQINGIVRDVLVSEGEVVKQNQPLVSLEPSELNATVMQARSAVAQAEAKLRQLEDFTLPAAEETLKQEQANLSAADSDFRRADQLQKNGAGSRAAFEQATRNFNVARALVRAAELRVAAARPQGSDRIVAQTELDQANANLTSAEVRLGYATIAAPRNGILISRAVERGTVVQPGAALMVLAPAGDTQLVLQIDEKNLGSLAVGQKAIASADAFPNERFEATLSYINPSVDMTRAAVEVKLTVDHPPAYLRQDMTISVDIAVDRRLSTLVVPARVVHDATSAAPFVLVVRGGRVQEQVITTGLRAGDKVEVLSGLEEGDLTVPIAGGVRAGQRVRAVQS